MAKMMIKRIGILSAAKIYGVICLVLGLIIGVFYGLFTMLLGAFLVSTGGGSGMEAAGPFIGGLLFIVFFPILYGVAGFIGGALMGVIYNAAAKYVGGVELELENAAPDYISPPPPPQWNANSYGASGGGV